MHVTVQSLEEKYGDRTAEVFDEISRLSGAGLTARDAHDGGISVSGALDPDNKAVSAENKKAIQELLSGLKTPAASKPEAPKKEGTN